jgi:hypothetical protein
MGLAQRLRDAEPEVQDTFAAARAAIDQGDFEGDGLAAVKEMLIMRDELGWEDE